MPNSTTNKQTSAMSRHEASNWKARVADVGNLLGKIRVFLRFKATLMKRDISKKFMVESSPIYADTIQQRCQALQNCFGSVDGTVIAVSRPGDHEAQNMAYNGHKRKHALRYQAITTADGLILHAYGSLEGHRHDWILLYEKWFG